MSENFFLGMDAKLYYSDSVLTETGGASASWTEASNVKDVNLNLSTGEADVTTRAGNGWRQTAATLREGEITFDLQAKSNDAFLTAVKDAWLSGGELAVWALTGDKDETGHEGPMTNATVVNFSRSEPLEEAVTYSVTLKPSSFTGWEESSDGGV